MPGPLLRSGSLREFHPLGALGNPVYSAASQLRAAMRRHVGADVADLFAIPRRHEPADTIDWYAPQAGEVVPWSAATAEQRAAARAALLAVRARIAAHSQALQAHESSERQVFGKLLAQATQIPSEDHIYLVGGRPVLTFWGFHPLGARAGFDAISGLEAGPSPSPQPAPPPPPAPVVPRRWRWWWLLLPFLFLLLLLVLLLRSCGVDAPWLAVPPLLRGATPTPVGLTSTLPVGDASRRESIDWKQGGRPGAEGGPEGALTPSTAAPGAPPSEHEPPAAGPAEQPSAAPGTPPVSPAAPVTQTAGGMPLPSPPRPGEGSTPPSVTQPAGMPKPPAGAPPPAASRPPESASPTPAGTPLTIPEQAVRDSSTEFLNGAWRSITGLQDRTGKPVELRYDFKNGEGTVSLVRSTGSRQELCAGQVGSTMRDGRLVITQNGIRCPDGSPFQDSKIECSVGAGGKAVCHGINEDGTTYDVDIVK